MQYGIRSVTMDDIARATSMSKKTLYQYFENKDQLVLDAADHHFRSEEEEFQCLAGESENAVHEILLVSKCLRKHVFRMNPALLYDMQKYHGDTWDRYLQFKEGVIKGQLERNLQRGKDEGVYRAELDPAILSVMRVEQVQLVFNQSIFPTQSFDFTTVQLQLLDHFIHGLLTDEGREKYIKYTNDESLTDFTNL